jgi:hypothetical protein
MSATKEGTTAEYDLRKIIWFAQRELDRIENEREQPMAEPDVHSFMRALRLDPDQ